MRRALLTTDTVLGTDAIVTLDGRWNADTVYLACYTHVTDIQRLHPGVTFTGYEVYGSNQSLFDKPQKTVVFHKPIGPLNE